MIWLWIYLGIGFLYGVSVLFRFSDDYPEVPAPLHMLGALLCMATWPYQICWEIAHRQDEEDG